MTTEFYAKTKIGVVTAPLIRDEMAHQIKIIILSFYFVLMTYVLAETLAGGWTVPDHFLRGFNIFFCCYVSQTFRSIHRVLI